ncbi:MAG: hypothetical protein ACI4NV_05875, partial [Thermoguttaceae bacterium]
SPPHPIGNPSGFEIPTKLLTLNPKPILAAALSALSLTLCFVPRLQVLRLPTLLWNAVGISGAIGSGLWGVQEFKKEKAEVQSLLKTAVKTNFSILQESSIESIKERVERFFRKLGSALQDIQSATVKDLPTEESSKARAELESISKMIRLCDEIVDSLNSNKSN